MLKIILMISMILTGSLALAAQDFEYIPGNKIKAQISTNNLNRIEFGKIGIAQIIGDESKYKIIADSKAQNIFPLIFIMVFIFICIFLWSFLRFLVFLGFLNPDKFFESQLSSCPFTR